MDPKIVVLGLESLSMGELSAAAQGRKVIQWPLELERLAEAETVPDVALILCGPPPPGTALVEVAQLLRMQYPEAAIFYLTTNRTGFVRKDFIKNGFTDAFLIPIDSPTFRVSFKEELAKRSGGAVRAYRTVKLVDLQPGQEMSFDTYIHLPSNNKHIRISAAGDTLDPERAEKLRKHKVGNLHIQAEDMQKFYAWTAQQLKNLGQSDKLSATEKQDRMLGAVRELISDIFQDSTADQSFERGKQVVSDCQEIVKAYIMTTAGAAESSWYDKMIALSQSENTAYTAAATVSTFAAMFAMATGMGNPEHLAMAGLLCDIGLSEVPPEIQTKPEQAMSAEERKIYNQHPRISLTLIQTRKMVVPEAVQKIIVQHHERFDGKGYPDELRGAKIRPEAQLLGIAVELCSLTSGEHGGTPMTPFQAMKKMHDEIPNGEDGHKYDPALLRKLYHAFKPKD